MGRGGEVGQEGEEVKEEGERKDGRRWRRGAESEL